jgi:alpha-glucosidase (family GH31 glycosyl hydrolase)
VQPLSQFDFTAGGTEQFYGALVDQAIADGHDGWMEDFGEYTPPDAESADGTPGAQMHNRYPTDYHCAGYRIALRQPRPVIRFQRSGWTGSARCADDVWGGDPTSVFGYDGLSSAIKQALSVGMSGISRWGSDIGGYFSYGPGEQLTPELLKRWIEFGAVSGVMRTKGSGIAVPSYARPQIYDSDVLPVWRRYAKLHTQLFPYILAADRAYRDTGLPLMRSLALVAPTDERALTREDEFMFGPDLLAAPVVEPGAVERPLYVPRGRWVDLWRSAAYDEPSGGLELRRPRVIRGGAESKLPAPLDELPLLARVGTLLPLLPSDVDTLAAYGSRPGLVHLGDRRGRMTLLAFPRGRSHAAFNDGERLEAVEGPRRSLTFTVRGDRTRRYDLQASLTTLRRPFTPRRVRVGNRALPASAWRYARDTDVLRVSFRMRSGRLRVDARASRHVGRRTAHPQPGARFTG